jgi:hypothetical protein
VGLEPTIAETYLLVVGGRLRPHLSVDWLRLATGDSPVLGSSAVAVVWSCSVRCGCLLAGLTPASGASPGVLGNLLMCSGRDELRLEVSIDIVYSTEVSS